MHFSVPAVLLWGIGGVVCACFPVQGADAQGMESGCFFGTMINVDPYLDIVRNPVRGVHAAYVHPTSAADTTGFARAFGYPLFSYGLAVTDFGRVRVCRSGELYGSPPSRLGTTVALYAGFERPFLPAFRRRSYFSYALRGGIGASNHTWNRNSNAANELIGSALSVYFGAGLYFTFGTGRWRFRLGQDFGHFSNGALARPNKGANYRSTGISVVYVPDGRMGQRTEQPRKGSSDAEGRLLVDITYHLGLKTSIGEWLTDRTLEDQGRPLKYGRYGLYVSHGVSAALLYRYDLRLASGLGVDLFYEPYLNHIEIQNPDCHATIPGFSVGVSARHRVIYKRMALRMALGVYLARRFARYAHTDEEYGYYERVGLSYTLPLWRDGFCIGCDVRAHRTKAYASEISLGWQFPMGKHKKRGTCPFRAGSSKNSRLHHVKQSSFKTQ